MNPVNSECFSTSATARVNAVELFCQNALRFPHKDAIVFELSVKVSYQQLYCMAARAQNFLKQHGFKAGDGLLVFSKINPELYAVIIAALAQGVALIFVEPWMPVHLISRVICNMKPKAFVCSKLGRLWGWRVPAIREIKQHFTAAEVVKKSSGNAATLDCELLRRETKGIVTFTSGTTGLPKGVSRPHGYLIDAARIFHANMENSDEHNGTDLCIFANFTLLNLAAGKTTVLFPSLPVAAHFQALHRLAAEQLPTSVTCGPAFLSDLISLGAQYSSLRESLKAVHVGGAPSDCSLWERAFEAFPQASFTHIYGSSEVEPVAIIDACEAVRLSRLQGFYQNLCVGRTVPEISTRVVNDELWVSGPHVCPEYISASEAEHLVKQRDSANAIWHNMGDRVTTLGDDPNLWYLGRSSRSLENVLLEQQIFCFLDSSDGFLLDSPKFGKSFVTSSAQAETSAFRKCFSDVNEVVRVRNIERDKRHRSRIDVKKTIGRNAPWLVG